MDNHNQHVHMSSVSSIDEGKQRKPLRSLYRNTIGRLPPGLKLIAVFGILVLVAWVAFRVGAAGVTVEQGESSVNIDMNRAIVEDTEVSLGVVAVREIRFVASADSESDSVKLELGIPLTPVKFDVPIPFLQDNLNNSGTVVGFKGQLMALVPEDAHRENLDLEAGVYRAEVDEIVTDYAQVDFGETNIPSVVKHCDMNDEAKGERDPHKLFESDLDPANIVFTRLICHTHAVFANQETPIALHLLYQNAEYAVATSTCMEDLRLAAFNSVRQEYQDYVDGLGVEGLELELDLTNTRFVTQKFEAPPSYENITINISPQICSG